MDKSRNLFDVLVFYFMEIWKKINLFDNYEISNNGSVRRVESQVFQKGTYFKYKGRILKQATCKGYKRVTLCKNSSTKRFQVHRLVAMLFIENIENKPCVNHIDGDKLNNNYTNLEWCTYSENEKHSYISLGKINHNRKLTIDNVILIKKNGIKGKNGNIKYLSELFQVGKSTILNVLKNKYYV
jgi:hypothetical protein